MMLEIDGGLEFHYYYHAFQEKNVIVLQALPFSNVPFAETTIGKR
jgi:hypothetical protein